MTRISLEQGFYKSKSFIANAQRCLNLFPEIGTGDGPSPTTCYPTPGLRLLATAPAAPFRGLYFASNNQGYAVVGSQVFTIGKNWQFTSIGELDTAFGPVSIKDNGIDLVIVDQTTMGYFVPLSGGTIGTISDPTGSFVGSTNVEYLDS